MSTPEQNENVKLPPPQAERKGTAERGSMMLCGLVVAWLATFFFSASEPPIMAALFGIPAFLLTPVVTIGLLLRLQETRQTSMKHRITFYGSATLLAAWVLFLIAGALSN